ncbi:hypothetical protein P5673_030357 [Acropora cervicornis]|uniref:EGF-like domain-containing protein n=1 Tax=Acropora cervicornis TaxID=6130 RepID=A0AAD9PUA5_ACRCE|nr:hypothetical protein P5673_030357 [Acropora cervicornis]
MIVIRYIRDRSEAFNCTNSTCQNGGTCYADKERKSLPSCKCPPQYSGHYCEISLPFESTTQVKALKKEDVGRQFKQVYCMCERVFIMQRHARKGTVPLVFSAIFLFFYADKLVILFSFKTIFGKFFFLSIIVSKLLLHNWWLSQIVR